MTGANSNTRRGDTLNWWATGACPTGKRCHPNAKSAREAKKKLRTLGSHVRPYRCEHCGFFHVGHLPAAVMRGEVDDDEFYGRR